MKELEEIIGSFIRKDISLDNATIQITQVVYKNPYYFGLENLNRDYLHSFLLWGQKRFQSILLNYNPSGGFSTFCRKSIFLCAKSFVKICAHANAKEESFREIAYIDEEEKQLKYSIYDDYLECKSSNVPNISCKEFLNLYLKQKGHHWKYDVMIENLRKAACLILTLKACCYVDSDIIRKVSLVTNLSEYEINDLINQLKSRLEKKIQKRKTGIQSRDSAYYLKKRYLIEANKIDDDSATFEKMHERYQKQSKLWEKRNKELKKKKYKAIPSNMDLAEILNVSDRRIAYVIKRAQMNIDTISLSDYDIEHETIFSNRK